MLRGNPTSYLSEWRVPISIKNKPSAIHEDTWSEFSRIAALLRQYNEEADIYDVFMLYRQFILGGQPFSPALIAKIDAQLEKELGPWT